MSTIFPKPTFQPNCIRKKFVCPGKSHAFPGSPKKNAVNLIIFLRIIPPIISRIAPDFIKNNGGLIVITGRIIKTGQKLAYLLVNSLPLFRQFGNWYNSTDGRKHMIIGYPGIVCCLIEDVVLPIRIIEIGLVIIRRPNVPPKCLPLCHPASVCRHQIAIRRCSIGRHLTVPVQIIKNPFFLNPLRHSIASIFLTVLVRASGRFPPGVCC